MTAPLDRPLANEWSPAHQLAHTTTLIEDPEPLISAEQAAADAAYFEEKWGNTASQKEIDAEREKARQASARHYENKVVRKARVAKKQTELDALIVRYAHLRESREGFSLDPAVYPVVMELAALRDEDGERKWSWRAIGRIVGISGPTAREIADSDYAAKRSAYGQRAQ